MGLKNAPFKKHFCIIIIKNKIMSKDKDNEKEDKDFFLKTPDGELKVLKSFSVEAENRRLTLIHLADESLVINVKRYEESVDSPYEKEITNQVMRLSKLTFSMLLACFIKADIDFDVNANDLLQKYNSQNK
jgi:hypothetical protein